MKLRWIMGLMLMAGMIAGCCGNKVGCDEKAKSKPPLLVALTFDDGLKDHVTIVAPALARYGYKGSFNLITGSIGAKNHLTWDEVRQLDKEGHELVSHTINHPNMRKLVHENRAEFDRQIKESVAKIEAETGVKVQNVCLPGNNGDEAVEAAIHELGYGQQEKYRPNLGGDFGAKEVGEYLDGRIREGDRRCALMMHAIQGAGYRPFPNGAADFEAVLKLLKEREDRGQVRVVSYAEAYAK